MRTSVTGMTISPVLRRSAIVVGIGLVYFAAGKLGLSLAFVNASASPVWPPTGIAIAAVLLFGPMALPAIFGGALFTNLTTAGNLSTSLAIAAGNTLEAFVAAWLITRFANGKRAFQSPRDVFAFAIIVVFIATPVSATIGVAALMAAGLASLSAALLIWNTWWLGDAAGALVFAPVVLLWYDRPNPGWDRNRAAHAALLTTLTLAVAYILFRGDPLGLEDSLPLEFLCIPPIIWAAYAFGQREAATLAAALSLIAVWGTLDGLGPFARANANESLLLVQTFIAVITLLALPLAAVVDERRRDGDALRMARDQLALRAEERGRQLSRTEGRRATPCSAAN